MSAHCTGAWQRRARPLLGTLVEIGLPAGSGSAAFDAAFAAVHEVQCCLSRFEPDSDVARFHALPCGAALRLRRAGRAVFAGARALRDASAARFDITLGTAPHGWRCDGRHLVKLDPAVRLDLGGIGKGHAVDRAVHAARRHGCAAGWVNAGGDLRVFGDLELPIGLRDERRGGRRPFGQLRDGAFATSDFGAGCRSLLAGGTAPAHVSVAAPRCLWADALTKLVALSGDPAHPLLARHGAQAWLH